MSSRKVVALWFVLQIVVPFTAPLQTCDVRDLLGPPQHGTQSTSTSPESFSTPTLNDPDIARHIQPTACSFPSQVAPSRLGISIPDGALYPAALQLLPTLQRPASPGETSALVLRL
jgi:hypothetical protein